MSEADAALLAALPALAFQAVLVFARLGAAVMVLPGLGEAEVPAPVRLASWRWRWRWRARSSLR